MKNFKILISMLVIVTLIVGGAGAAFAMDYSKRMSQIRPSVELSFQDYAVDTVSATNAAYVEASLTLTGIYANFVRLLNDSDYDAWVKLNEEAAFTLQGGMTLCIGFDDITKVEIKSKTADTTVVEVSVWGRTDLDV